MYRLIHWLVNLVVLCVHILMYQLCKGVDFCHGRGVLHRDLKPRNLLMDRKTMAFKIADLELSCAFTVPLKKYTHEVSDSQSCCRQRQLACSCHGGRTEIPLLACMLLPWMHYEDEGGHPCAASCVAPAFKDCCIAIKYLGN